MPKREMHDSHSVGSYFVLVPSLTSWRCSLCGSDSNLGVRPAVLCTCCQFGLYTSCGGVEFALLVQAEILFVSVAGEAAESQEFNQEALSKSLWLISLWLAAFSLCLTF